MTDDKDALKTLERIEVFIDDCECMCVEIRDDIRSVERHIRALTSLPGAVLESLIKDAEDARFSSSLIGINFRAALPKLKAALQSSAKKQGWQPIETAPRDGTEILVSWHGWPSLEGDNSIEIAIFKEGVWWSNDAVVSTPSHWMPLPPPPPKEETKYVR
jgi:hypothetical protein